MNNFTDKGSELLYPLYEYQPLHAYVLRAHAYLGKRNASWKIRYIAYHPPMAIGHPRCVEPFPAFSPLSV